MRGSTERGGILAIDGVYFCILKPKLDAWKYYNRKGTFSLNFLCLVDYKKRFRGISYDYGSCHDARVYRNAGFKDLIENLNGFYVLGDPAFTRFINIKCSYSTVSELLTQFQVYELGSRRVIVENAFGLLKNKFNRLAVKMVNGEKKKGVQLVKSCIWIHNFIIDSN